MLSPFPLMHPGCPAASHNATSAVRLTIVEADDPMSCGGLGNNQKAPESSPLGTAEDHPTLTERILTFLDKRCA